MRAIYLTLFLLFVGALSAQEEQADRDAAAIWDLMQRRSEQAVTNVTRLDILNRIWEAQADLVITHIMTRQSKELEDFENSEFSRTRQAALQLEIFERYRQNLKRGVSTAHKVAFIGYNSNPFEEQGINTTVLAELLNSIQYQEVDALFFMGDLIWGLTLPPLNAPQQGFHIVELPPVFDDLGTPIYQASGDYERDFYEKRLAFFASFVKTHLKTVPFYPLMGESDVVGPDCLNIFMKQFQLPSNARVLDSSQLVYTVKIGEGEFTLLSFSHFDEERDAPSGELVTPPLLNWLEATLPNQKSSYRFVVGNPPAFSTGAVFNAFSGLDRRPEERNSFWQTLMKHRVLAYFCSNEVLYDRSYRYGIWQLISGGGGAVRDVDPYALKPFYHYLLLTIPDDLSRSPVLQVYDLEGRVVDEVQLSSTHAAIFDLRITVH